MNTRGTFARVALVVMTSGGAAGCGFPVLGSSGGTACPDPSQGPAPSHAITVSDDAGCSSWSCEPGWVDCGGGACSVDVLTDPHQCGDCGNSCPEGTCSMGSCGPVDVLATNLSWAGAVAVDSASVYFVDTTPLLLVDSTLYLGGSLLVRTALDGGGAQLLASIPGSVSGLAVDATGFYYLAGSEVVLVPTTSGTSPPVVVGSTSISAAADVDASDPDGGALTSFAVGGGSVWWLRTFGGADGADAGAPAMFDLVRESEADSGVQLVATAPIVATPPNWLESTSLLTIGGGDAFFASNGALEVVRAGSSTVQTLTAEPQCVIGNVAADDAYVYWTSWSFGSGGPAPLPPALARMPRAGGEIQALLPSTSFLSQLVVSDGLAWGTQPGIAGDDLVRVDGTGALTVLSGGRGTIGGVAVDATSVYWTVTAQGTSGVGQLLRTDR
jgi:hypothetical protein